MMQFKAVAILGSQELVLRLTYLTPLRLSLIKRHRTKGLYQKWKKTDAQNVMMAEFTQKRSSLR